MIDVGSANNRAQELKNMAADLSSARDTLNQYLTEITSNWEAEEVKYYTLAIQNVKAKIDSLSQELNDIANSVSTTAQQIRAEEEEAARRQREAEAAAAAAAAAAYNRMTNGS